MRTFFSKHFRTILIILTVAVSLALIVSAMFMLADYKTEITDRASSRAQYNTGIVSNHIRDDMDVYLNKAVSVATQISSAGNDVNKLKEVLGPLENTIPDQKDVEDVVYANFSKSGTLYTSNADEITKIANDVADVEGRYASYRAVKTYVDNPTSKAKYIGTYKDEKKTQILFAVYAPVENSTLADGVFLYYTRSKLESFLSGDFESEYADFTVFCTSDGSIIKGSEYIAEALATGESVEIGNIGTILRKTIGDKTPSDEFSKILIDGNGGTIKTQIGTNDYIISVGADKTNLGDLIVVELYNVNKLCASGIDFIYSVIAIVILFVVVAIGVMVYLLVHSIRMKNKLFDTRTTDDNLRCNNRLGFEEAAKKIMENNKTSNFFIIITQIRHLKHLHDTYGEGEISSLLRHVKLSFDNNLQEEETYGYIGDGQFVSLIHSADRNSLRDRLKMISFIVSKYKGPNKYNVLLKFGIYDIIPEESASVKQMMEFASEANASVQQATAENSSMIYNFYDNELRRIRLINEDMELRMESALQNKEFQVFYQPKYNLNLNRQDGAEALVRWYDIKSGVFNRPALFMALFESNGFIIKLDKYVFTLVCQYINNSIAQGREVYPISVNVSRITAVQPDFLDFYIRTKRKYGIQDGLIMIEFTESFAYENYETLYQIVDALHRNGFKCSIDDFGCGYSSYLILKSLPMDEIKLDKFFMEKGIDDERDIAIFESVISLAKKLKMKVTQEGVETMEDIKKIRKLGCDVVQGYVYAKPIAVSDYINFVQNSASHNI